ncbi:MAG TPA: hypothetical protein VIE43_19090 [Thermoanaerobaculia bacterium]|nr:hypothetical protein [Thermoanaerobaculia bacterium]
MKLQDGGPGSRTGVPDAGKGEILKRGTLGTLKKRPARENGRPGSKNRRIQGKREFGTPETGPGRKKSRHL